MSWQGLQLRTASSPAPGRQGAASSAAAGRPQAHTGDVEGLTAYEVKAVCARLAATAPYLRVLAKVVPPDQLWRVCRKECQGRDLHDDGWIIKPRWFGIVVVATGPHGKISGPSTIEWRTFAGLVTGLS